MIYLSYKGSVITQDNNGYINATEMCRINNKKVDDWVKTKKAQNYISYISKDLNIPASQLVISIKGNSSDFTQGTWIHPELGICLGRWVSVAFAVWCDRNIKKYLESENYAPPPPHRELGAYEERVKEMFAQAASVPKGYWCVLHESANLLIWVETQLKCPVDKADLLDGSIGKHWSKYREGKPWALDRIDFSYTFPDGRIVKPWCYRMSELGYFRSFLQDDYSHHGLISYLNKKYPGIVKF
jgi:hypothetical protein